MLINTTTQVVPIAEPVPTTEEESFTNHSLSASNLNEDGLLEHSMNTSMLDTSTASSSTSTGTSFAKRVYFSKGPMGALERIPLWLKLVFSLVLAFAGVFAFGLVAIVDRSLIVKREKTFEANLSVVTTMANLIHKAQHERGYYTMAAFFNGTTAVNNMRAVRVHTDERVLILERALTHENVHLSSESSKLIRTIMADIDMLASIRNGIDNDRATYQDTNTFYTTWITNMIQSIVLITSSEHADPSSLILQLQYTYVIRAKERFARIRAAGIRAIKIGQFIKELYDLLSNAVALKNEELRKLSLLQTPGERLQFFEDVTSRSQYLAYVEVEQQTMSDPSIVSLDKDAWFANMTTIMNDVSIVVAVSARHSDCCRDVCPCMENDHFTFCYVTLISRLMCDYMCSRFRILTCMHHALSVICYRYPNVM